MAKQIIWSQIAEEDFDQIIKYLEERWSEEIAIRFVNTFYKKLGVLAEQPLAGLAVKNNDLMRKILVGKFHLLLR